MADDVTVDNGAGTDYVVATDDVGGEHAQIVKLAYSANGDRTHLQADADGLLVNLGSAATATLSNVNDSATSQALLASNTARKGVVVYNDSTVALYLKYGATASTTSFSYYLAPGAHWEMPAPVYTGAIDGIWASNASGAARITELT